MTTPTVAEAWTTLAADALAPHLAGARRVAYLDCPDHVNVGDSMIALGAFTLLSRMDKTLAYVASLGTYDRERVSALGDDCAIVIHGGGNFGDLWPRHQTFRERVLTDFPDRRIVQLPQTIHFADPMRREAAGGALRAHPHLHVLCRDEPSLREAHALGLRASLSPDHALCLPAMPSAAPRYPVVVLKRTDKEARADASDARFPASWMIRDWLTNPPRPSIALDQALQHAVVRQVLPERTRRWLRRHLLVSMARARVAWGAQLVTEGRVLLTDRLHAHVLFCLAGRRHAFVDNSYGKLRAVYSAWTHRYGLATPCHDWSAAIRWAEQELRNAS